MTDPSVPHSEANSTVPSSVIDRARNGDDVAFQRILRLYSGLVFHWCRNSGLVGEDAKDVCQEVFLSASRNLQSFRREKPGDSFRGWLRIIVRSRIADHFRKTARQEKAVGGSGMQYEAIVGSLLDEDSVHERQSDSTVLYQQAVQLIQGEFAEHDCKAFYMTVVDGLAAREVADKLGISVNSVYIAKSRILKRLKTEFAELLDDD